MVTSNSELKQFLTDARRSRHLIVDTEGDGKDVRDASCDPVTMGVTLAYRDVEFKIKSEYFAFFHMIGDNQPEFFDDVCDLISTHNCLVMHNAKHDLVALQSWKINRFNNFYDTMIMAHQINENRLSYKLNDLSRAYGGAPKNMPPLMEGIINIMGWGHVPSYLMRDYSVNDGVITLELFEKIYPEFCAQGLDGELWNWEEKWIYLISQMEKFGIRVDKSLCEREIAKGERIIAEIKTRLNGLNPLSGNDLEELLIKRLGLPIVKASKKTGRPSFDKQAMRIYTPMLEKMGSPIAQDIVRYRGWTKVLSTNYKAYLNLRDANNRIHPNYKIHGTVTRRLSSGSDSDGKSVVTSPNFQNIPRVSEKEWDGHLKQAFVAEDGYTLYDADYGQAEMRLAAVYSADPKLLEIFNSGQHLFKTMAEELGWEYNDTKTFVYATNYNASNRRIADTFNISLDDASRMRDQFINAYPKLMKFKQYVGSRAQRTQYIKYWTGARRHFESPKEAWHLAFNSLIQGGVAEIVKRAAVRLSKEIDWETCRILLQVHDNLVSEIKNGYEEKWIPVIRQVMEEIPSPIGDPIPGLGLTIPFPVEIKKWGV